MSYEIIIATLTGTLLSAVVSCIPGFHIYNLLGVFVWSALSFDLSFQPGTLFAFFAGAIVGYSIASVIPSVFLGAPDESAVYTVLPGQKYLMKGKGREAVLITASGSLISLFILLLIVAPVSSHLLPVIRQVFARHHHWILWCVIAFMLLSEWPKLYLPGQRRWHAFITAWKTLAAGILTFILSGILGFVLIWKTPLSIYSSYQNLMPAFIGFFAVPWLFLNIIAKVTIPQQGRNRMDLSPHDLYHGVIAGSLGGGFAAFFPVVTGGIGAMLSGHACALRNDKAFLVSQGASRTIYYVGSLFLFFVPALDAMTRGGGASMLKTLSMPRSITDFYAVLASIAISGAVTFLILDHLSCGMIRVIEKTGYRVLSMTALIGIIVFVTAFSGCAGTLVLISASAIGMIPVLCGSRRMNCLGVILLPIACNMSGIGDNIAAMMKLI